MTRILLLAFSLMLAQDDPPPEPPASRPPCHNYHDSDKDNCHCPKAMRDDGTGSEGTYPDRARGEAWCGQYCKHDKCLCVSPMKHVMPWRQ